MDNSPDVSTLGVQEPPNDPQALPVHPQPLVIAPTDPQLHGCSPQPSPTPVTVDMRSHQPQYPPSTWSPAPMVTMTLTLGSSTAHRQPSDHDTMRP